MPRSCGGSRATTRRPIRCAGRWRWRRSTPAPARTAAAVIGGVTLQVIRDWVLRFNAAGPDGLKTRKAPGQRPKLASRHRAALAAMIENGPIPAVHGVVRWRITPRR